MQTLLLLGGLSLLAIGIIVSRDGNTLTRSAIRMVSACALILASGALISVGYGLLAGVILTIASASMLGILIGLIRQPKVERRQT